jgi:hypothetical protein
MSVSGSGTFAGSLILNGVDNRINSGNELRFYRGDNAIYTKIFDAGSLAANGFTLDNTNAEGFHFKNNGTTIMRMNSSGNVGIGTNNPLVPLHIKANTPVTLFDATGVSTGRSWEMGTGYGGVGVPNFYIYDNTANSARLVITSTGNVEVGQTGFSSPNGADRFIGIYGGQDCSLILQDAVQLWELYVNDDFYINRGSTNVLTALRSNGNVGIGMTSAPSKLSVDGNLQINGTITNLGTGIDTYTQTTWYIDINNQILFENGRTTNSAAGTGRTVYFTWRGGPGVGGGVQLQHGANAWAAYTSDTRLKTKVADIENGVDTIMKLNPIKFKWSRELENSRTVTGFTAQNVEEAIPDAVFNSWQDEELGDVKSYYQDYLVPYLVKAIQELKAEIDELKNK